MGDNLTEPQPDLDHGPFAVGPVDPIVYRKSVDAPELRAAAALLSAQHLEIPREDAPAVPDRQTFKDWTPGDAKPVEDTPNIGTQPVVTVYKPRRQVLKGFVTVLTFLVPLGILAVLIRVGVLLTTGS